MQTYMGQTYRPPHRRTESSRQKDNTVKRTDRQIYRQTDKRSPADKGTFQSDGRTIDRRTAWDRKKNNETDRLTNRHLFTSVDADADKQSVVVDQRQGFHLLQQVDGELDQQSCLIVACVGGYS